MMDEWIANKRAREYFSEQLETVQAEMNVADESTELRLKACNVLDKRDEFSVEAEETGESVAELEDKDSNLKKWMTIIENIEIQKEKDYEYNQYYDQLIRKTEKDMCDYLTEIEDAEQIKNEFECDCNDRKKRLQLIQRAFKPFLHAFVTHPNAQWAFRYVLHKDLLYQWLRKHLNDDKYFETKTVIIGKLIGLLFPLLSLFYIIAPNSKLGSLVIQPLISYECELMSDIVFLVLLATNTFLKKTSIGIDYLGAPPTVLEWFILIWIIGKWGQVIHKISHGRKQFFEDQWNKIFIIEKLLHLLFVLSRLSDYIMNGNSGYIRINKRIFQPEWKSYQPRLIAAGAMGWIFIFCFVKRAWFLSCNEYLWSIKIACSLMVGHVCRFLIVFLWMIAAFAFCMNELYWYYDTPEGKEILCPNVINKSTCIPLFSGWGNNYLHLLFTIFGQFSLSRFNKGNINAYMRWHGTFLVVLFHLFVVITLLNLLVAVMTKLYQRKNSECECLWKYYETKLWFTFFVCENDLPPPMNLFNIISYFIHKKDGRPKDLQYSPVPAEASSS